MIKNLKRAGLVAALALGAMTAATTAEARDRYYRGHRGGDDAAIAIGAGVIGLALGAAIASGNRDRYYYDDDYYYGRPRYYRSYPRGYYYEHYPRRHYDYRYDRRGDRGRHRGWDNRRYRGW